MALRPLLPLLVLVLAGCAAPAASPPMDATPFAKDTCDPSAATTLNAAAPVVPALRGSGIDVARALAAAVDDPIVSDTPTDASDDFARWSTTRGIIQVDRDRGEGLWSATYSAPPSDLFSAAGATDVATRLGVSGLAPDASNSASHGALRQTLGNGRMDYLHGLGPEMGRWGSLTAWALRDLSRAQPVITEEQAQETAIAYDRCDMDREGRTAAAGYVRQGEPDARLSAYKDAVVWQVGIAYTQPTPTHCGTHRTVVIDAVTGAVAGEIMLGCD